MVRELVSRPRVGGDPEDEQVKRILLVLIRANGPAPLGYISLHTGIRDPFEVLGKMEERGLVRRSAPSHGFASIWSCSMEPMYEVGPAE